LARLIRTDFHIHTNHSPCGSPEATPLAVVRAAQEAGLEAVAITDHVEREADYAAPRAVREELRGYAGDLRVYVGCEAAMVGRGEPTISREYAAEMDLVLLSPSHLDLLWGSRALDRMSAPEMASLTLDLTRDAIRTGYADIIAHPFHVPVSGCPPFGQLVAAANDSYLRDTLAMAAEAGVAMEANPRFLRQDPVAATWLFRLFIEMGCKIAINSDSHHPSGIGCRGPRFASDDELRAIGITEERLFRIEERVT
jgi:histidinol phosphatase-like PHP family hydrolase